MWNLSVSKKKNECLNLECGIWNLEFGMFIIGFFFFFYSFFYLSFHCVLFSSCCFRRFVIVVVVHHGSSHCHSPECHRSPDRRRWWRWSLSNGISHPLFRFASPVVIS